MSETLELAAALVRTLEHRAKAEAARGLRRSAMVAGAATIGAGALVWLSLAAFFALQPAIGPGWAALILALFWGVAALALLAVTLALPRRRQSAGLPTDLIQELMKSSKNDLEGAAPMLALGALVAGMIAASR